MRKSLFAAAIVLSAGAVANAGVIHWIDLVDNTAADAEVPGFSSNHYTFDLMVTVDAGDDWTSISASSNLVAGTFYQHALGSDIDPSQAFVDMFPSLAFDSFYAVPEALFDGDAPGFAAAAVWTDTTGTATWFDTPVHDAGGSYTLARYTILCDAVPGNGILGSVVGFSTMRNTAGDPWNYDLNFVVPAPGSAAMLGLAGLVGLRRRR